MQYQHKRFNDTLDEYILLKNTLSILFKLIIVLKQTLWLLRLFFWFYLSSTCVNMRESTLMLKFKLNFILHAFQ